MPYFTPDAEKFAIGRPYKLWWAKLIDDAHWLCFKDKYSEPVRLYSPFQEELDEYQYTFDSGRETFVDYELVREMDLTKYGRVFYRDDYDVQYTDQYVARPLPGKDYNKPFDRAVVPEPIWDPIPPPTEFVIDVDEGIGRARVDWELEPEGYFHNTRMVVRDARGLIVYDKIQPDDAKELILTEQDIMPWSTHTVRGFTVLYTGDEIASNEVTFSVVEEPERPYDLDVERGTTPSLTNVQIIWSYGYYFSQREQQIKEWIGQYSFDGVNWETYGSKPADGFSTGPFVFDFTNNPLTPDETVFFRIAAKSPYGIAYSEFIGVEMPYAPATVTLEETDELNESAHFAWKYNISKRDQIIDQDLRVKLSNGNTVFARDFTPQPREHIINMIDDTDGLVAWYHYFATLITRVISGETGEEYLIYSNVVDFRFTTSPELPMYLGTSGQDPPNVTDVWILWTFGYYFSKRQQEITKFTIEISEDMKTWRTIGEVPADAQQQFEYRPAQPLDKGKPYYFSVTAYNAWGQSSSKDAQPPDVYMLYIPKGPVKINLTNDYTVRQVANVDWTVDSDEFSKQEVVVSDAAGKVISITEIPVTDRTEHFGAPYFTDRYVKVRVTQMNGDVYESNTVVVNVPNWPDVPSNVRFVGTPTLTGAVVDFDATNPVQQKVTKYVAQYTTYPAGGDWKDCGVEVNPQTTFVNCTFNPPLRLGMNYWMRIVAYNDYGSQASDGKLTWNAR